MRKVGNCSVVNDLKFVTVFQKYGPCIKVQLESLHVSWYGGALAPMKLALMHPHSISAEEVYTDFRPTYASSQTTQGRPSIFQQDNTKPHTAPITTAQETVY